MAKLSAAQRKSFLAMKAPFNYEDVRVLPREVVAEALNHLHRTLREQDRDRKDARKYGKYGWNS
jgi:hypothetical protein